MKYLICNLKSNMTLNEIIDYEHSLRNFPKSSVNLIVCPPYPYLVFFRKGAYNLGSQDISRYLAGAYTGEVNATQLKSLNVSYSLIGHTERRNYFNEDNKAIVQKLKNALDNNISPIYIIGETKEEKLRGKTMSVLKSQLNRILSNFSKEEISNIIIAYEPVWAIGSGESINKHELEEIVLYLKKLIKDSYQIEIPIIYGGGVDKENILDFLPLVDGYLISSSALKIPLLEEIYNKIINFDKN